jgi:P-type Mg2+ transporter
VREGRRTFANTLKYVFIATSANFGNMFSMAGASLFLPFLPLLPKQILLINLGNPAPRHANGDPAPSIPKPSI